jgi:hypothetical protein
MSLRGLLNFISGDLERKTLLCVLVPLIFMAYFGTLAFACFWFPGTYDWRYRVISSLISPWNNPEFHWIPSAGITGTGLLMIPFVGYINRRVRVGCRLAANIGTFAFGSGVIWLILAALIVSQHQHGTSMLPRLHEMCARTSALGLATGMLLFCWCAIKGYFVPDIGNKAINVQLVVSWILLTLPPILVALGECLLLATYAHFTWSMAVYHALKNSVAWHLAFWEWVGSAAVFLFLISSALFLPEHAYA